MYLELCTKPKLLCDFYSVIQVLVDRSEIDRSELLAPCLKCILNRLPNKMYNDVLVSKSMCQIKHFGVCFPLTCKASSKFITLFFFSLSYWCLCLPFGFTVIISSSPCISQAIACVQNYLFYIFPRR